MENKFVQRFDETPESKLVKRASIGEVGYGENVEYELVIHYSEGYYIMEYQSENGDVISLKDYLNNCSNLI